MKKSLKVLLNLAMVLAVMLGILFGAAAISLAVDEHRDKNTNIENATVLSKDKTSGTRRSLPSYYLVIQEPGKSSITKVFIDLGAWTWCKEGSIYNDVPGEKGKCELGYFSSIEPPAVESTDSLGSVPTT